jgi:adenine C2-methylase RlmN of 23S rRNA A2503 and tRNA A37
MIQVKDFVPEKSKGSLFKSGKIQQFDEVLKEMNNWIETNNIDVVSIETVLLPNIHDSQEEGSQDTELFTGGESSSHWYQLMRVWYKA